VVIWLYCFAYSFIPLNRHLVGNFSQVFLQLESLSKVFLLSSTVDDISHKSPFMGEKNEKE